MEVNKHTPGPWVYEASTKTIRSVPANYWLASMDSWDGAVNHETNAHLIAAAPELLQTLYSLKANYDLGTIELDYHSLEMIEAAISNAQ